ncbi:MAG: MCE family protein [Solirubrobacterales bacterium]|nr:MCE family protein [Solirubrobacterales bacterium]
MSRALRDHGRAVAALAGLIVVALAIGGYILSNQRFYLPAWVPVIGTDFYTVEAELQTAQAVAPGQGQSVTIAGVKVGEIGSVELEDGRAVVELKIQREYAPIHQDASILLRSRTALKDMYLSLDPGSETAGDIDDGGRIPVENTLPDVNPDEILASLDGDTRDYLRILLSSGAQALEGDSPAQLRQTLKRFAPTARDTERITAGLIKRRRNIANVVHNLQRLTNALGDEDTRLAEFVDSANANFAAIARQDESLRAALTLLPGTLDQTASTLTSVDALATDLGPALEELRPGARALGPSLRQTRPFLRTTTPVIRDELRPFAVDVQPTIRDLRSAAEDLAVVTPRLTKAVRVVNSLLNTVAFNPPGREEGFLFWGAWANHAGATLFGTQDAHGPVRRGLLITSCSSLGVLDQIAATTPSLNVLIQLLNAPQQSDVCPQAVP